MGTRSTSPSRTQLSSASELGYEGIMAGLQHNIFKGGYFQDPGLNIDG